MNKRSTLHGLIALSMLAAAGATQAADTPAPAAAAPGKHAPFKRFDPVQHTQKRLDGLQAKLNLKEDQKSAWQAYSDAALARARERSAKLQDFHERRGEARKDLDTAARLDKAAEMMRARADTLQKVAQDTRTFQQALTPEQQTIFDLYWKAQQRGMRGGHRPA
jgi:Spy/CpxP family protein refolding chaperone